MPKKEDKLITESAGIFRALLDQNAKLSAAILERTQDENKKLKDAAAPKPAEVKP